MCLPAQSFAVAVGVSLCINNEETVHVTRFGRKSVVELSGEYFQGLQIVCKFNYCTAMPWGKGATSGQNLSA